MPNTKTILVIGASGFVGEHLYRFLASQNSIKVFGTCFRSCNNDAHIRMDITDFDSVIQCLKETEPTHILYAAGNKNVHFCESDFSQAYAQNSMGVRLIIEAIKQLKLSSILLYLSSDYVFDGERGRYMPEDMKNPKTNYGRTKLLGEMYITESNLRNKTNHKIIRSSAIMGQGGTFFEWLVASLRQHGELSLFSNIFFSPTPIQSLLFGIEYIMNNSKKTKYVYHVCGSRTFSRYSFAMHILSLGDNYFRSSPIPQEIELKQTLFQKDLTIIPSPEIPGLFDEQDDNYLRKSIDDICNITDLR